MKVCVCKAKFCVSVTPGSKLPSDDFDLKVLDQHTEVVPAPFKSECKATPPVTPNEEEILPEVDVPETDDIAPDLDNVLTDVELSPGELDVPLQIQDGTPLDGVEDVEGIKNQSSVKGFGGIQSQAKPSGLNNAGGRDGLTKDFTGTPATNAKPKGVPGAGDLQSMADMDKIPGSDILVRMS